MTAMTSSKRYAAGKATYSGEHDGILGQLVGPTTLGVRLLAVAATYDPGTDKTVVEFATPRAEDIAAAHADGFGIVRVPRAAA